MGKHSDLCFLKEIRQKMIDGLERSDPTQIDYAKKMIEDWIDELEEEIGHTMDK